MVRSVWSLFLVAFFASFSIARGESTLRGDLPRVGNGPLEAIPGLDSIYDVLVTRDGTRLRTILTKPEGETGRRPAILFLQWLSCDRIELPGTAEDGSSRIVRFPSIFE